MQTWLRRILALAALVGSVNGLYWVYIHIGALSISGGSFTDMALTALGVPLFLYGLMCGFWLLERRALSTTANSVFWLLQLPVLITPILSYKLYALVNLSLSTNEKLAPFVMQMDGPKGNIVLMLADGGKEQLFGINLFALLMILLLVIVGISTRREKSRASSMKTTRSTTNETVAMTGAVFGAQTKGPEQVANQAFDTTIEEVKKPINDGDPKDSKKS